MDFRITAEQELLRQSAEKWARGLHDSGVTRDAVEGRPIDHQGLWLQLADNGWLAITTPECFGGAGGSLVDACLVLESLSQNLAPIPYAGNAIIAPALLRSAEDTHRELASELLPALAEGRDRLAVVMSNDLTRLATSRSGVAFDWWPGDDILVGGNGLVVGDGAAVAPLQGVDACRPLGAVELTGDLAPIALNPRVLAVARTAASTALVGLMAGALELALAHAKVRHQFGRPIGSFQAVQHMAADMLVDLEASRAVAYGAAWSVDNAPLEEAVAAAAGAKAFCAAAGIRVCRTSIQILGGMGITWESDAHLYLRAAHVWAAAFGDELAALDEVARRLFNEPSNGQQGVA